MSRLFRFGKEFFWALVVLGVLLAAFYTMLSWARARGGIVGNAANTVQHAASPH